MARPMARTPDKDLKELISDLRSGTSTRKPPPRQQRKPQTAFLVAALVVIIGGAGYTIYSALQPKEETPNTESPGPDEAAPATATGTGGGPLPGAPGGGSSGPLPVYADQLRPPGVMQKLPLPLTAFMPAENLPAPAPGKPVEAWVLLCARLDTYTEQMWARAGLFRNESIVLSPFIRRVTLTDMEAFDLLIDWHVESAAVYVPETPPPPQPE